MMLKMISHFRMQYGDGAKVLMKLKKWFPDLNEGKAGPEVLEVAFKGIAYPQAIDGIHSFAMEWDGGPRKAPSLQEFIKWVVRANKPKKIGGYKPNSEPLNDLFYASRGLVKVITVGKDGVPSSYRLEQKADCIQDKGRWIRKVDFLIEKLGGNKVDKWFKTHQRDGSTLDLEKYRQIREDLLEAVLENG